MQKKRVSIVLPCRNEEKGIRVSIRWAKQGLRRLRAIGYSGDVTVVDNGSTDRSVPLAKKAGARLIREPRVGYGQAYRTGIDGSTGEYIIMGDSDGTYDFRSLKPFVDKLTSGADLVLGSRLGGTILPGAMAITHRLIGNPILTAILNLSCGSRLTDTQTGMRAFTRTAYKRMNLKSTGMEFASEMIIKAIGHKMRIAEVPIAYYPRIGTTKLHPLTDAWRHIKFMLLYTPTYALVMPGISLCFFGIAVSIIFFDVYTMTLGMFAANLGVQLILLGIFAKVYTENILKLPSGPLATFLLSKISVERLLVLGGSLCIISLAMILSLSAIREIIFAAGLGTIGAQTIFSSFLYGLMKES